MRNEFSTAPKLNIKDDRRQAVPYTSLQAFMAYNHCLIFTVVLMKRIMVSPPEVKPMMRLSQNRGAAFVGIQ
jgi:hypothetical protein